MNNIIKKIKEKSISYEQADIINKIFGAKGTDDYMNRPIIMFGTGSAAKHLFPILMEHGINISFFCDNNDVPGRTLFELPVLSFDELSKGHRDSLIIVSSANYYNEIRKQLLDCGFSINQIFGIDPGPLNFYTHLEQWRWRNEDLLHYEDQLQRTYDLLCDEKSKDLFLRRMALFHQGADYHSFCSWVSDHSSLLDFAGFEFLNENSRCGKESFLYFNNDIYEPEEGEILIDAGAYIGDTVKHFIDRFNNQNMRYGKVYCLEPDPANYKKLVNFTKELDNIYCVPKGAWSSETTMCFQTSEDSPESSVARISSDTGKITVEVCRIDDIVEPDDHVSLIKMDIEGAELEALKGAADTIRKSKPTLIVSVYHNRDDIFTLINGIDDICEGYKFYMRLFSNSLIEVVLIAVVE
jgi:FkbM family methyltransferase